MEEVASETTPEAGQTPSPEDTSVVPELSVDIELDADTSAKPMAPAEPEVRRGVLPPPPSDGKRVQPLAAKGQRSSSAPNRPSASGLPSGMRAPGVPEETAAENTDVLIASAVAALTEGDPADHSSALLTAEPRPTAASSATALPAPQPTPAPAEEQRKRRGLVLFGIAAIASLAVLAIVLSGGESDDPERTTPAGVVAIADVPSTPAPSTAAPLAAAAPEPPPLPVDVPPDVGAWVGREERFDVGDELAMDLDVGSGDDSDENPDGDAGEEDPSEAGASPRSGRSRKRKREPKQPATSSPRPPPASPANQPADAATLLADARKALAAGQARKAYSLASKSRSAKRTSAALVVMAKAACRFGGESQAKSAFNQLSVTNRRGLRAECRNRGVRLGL